MPNLVEKFTDSKILVRSANMKLLKKLMGSTSTKAVCEQLYGGMNHSSWRVKEEVLNSTIMVGVTRASTWSQGDMHA